MKSKVPMSYGAGMNVKTSKYGGKGNGKGTSVNGSFGEAPATAGHHRKTQSAPKFKGHQFSNKTL